MGKSKVIVFANQKGGVGKSTLCISYAHYLATKAGKLVGAVIDCDLQQTITKQRETDLKTYDKSYAYFQVQPFSLDNHNVIPDLVKSLKSTDDLVYLFDTPGTIQNQGLLSLLTLADAVICPFHFDRKTVASTVTFIKFIEKIREYIRQNHPRLDVFPLFLLPNMYDARIGTAEEKLLWTEVREEFSKFGIVCPDIPRRADLERCSTLHFLDNQSDFVSSSFDFINNHIFSSNDSSNENT